ncbi:hypothetical protein [Acinetobacter bouvetii]|uniref:Uncharacterized protein n=1 Tax=Acinetobacter bouvetii TaxID=202951 RepID=A0A811G960_9GAMM|nr:hypothetical protein [Acinetobacter bouvetii]CAB1210059.1 hypothetical protein SFB21_0734 [Acinetobacter bouvetii]
MNFKTVILMGGVGIALHGCTSLNSLSSEDSVQQFASAQELIVQKNINQPNGRAKEYVYAWGSKQSDQEPQSLYPRKYLNNYCSAKHGKFTLLYKSSMSLVKNLSDKKLLSASGNVKQGIGAYKCVQNNGQSWIASIEPVAERKLTDGSDARVVSLQTKIMSAEEAKKFYKNSGAITNTTDKKTTANEQSNKKALNKSAAQKELEVKKDTDLKKEVKPATDQAVKETVKVAETPQQQQMKFYVAARRDLNSGKNQVAACNNAQRAYNYGKLQGTEGTRVYTESGMLVARCLTSVPSYSNRFANSKGQAVKVLQNLANNYNHAGAKNMLRQMK